jgi:hypothetical protein
MTPMVAWSFYSVFTTFARDWTKTQTKTRSPQSKTFMSWLLQPK